MGIRRVASGTKLTPKQRVFALEYLACLNATEAYRRAYGATKNADVLGPRLLGTAGVGAFVAERQAKREAKLEISAERTVLELARCAYVDPADFFAIDGSVLPIRDMSENARRALAGMDVEELFGDDEDGERVRIGWKKKPRTFDKVRALELLAKHQGILVERHQVDVTVRSHAELLAEAYRRDVQARRKAGDGALAAEAAN